jgi:hypothetical protein
MYQNSRAQGKVVKARNRALQDDRVKQQALQAEADAGNQKTQAGFSLENQEAGRAAEVERALKTATGSEMVGDYTAATNGQPVQVQSEIARKIADALRTGKDYAKTSANLGSYGRQQFNNRINLTDNAIDLERINSFSRGNTGVLGAQLNHANNKGGGNRLSADLLGGIGDIALAYSLNNPLKKPAPVVDRSFKPMVDSSNSYAGFFKA